MVLFLSSLSDEKQIIVSVKSHLNSHFFFKLILYENYANIQYISACKIVTRSRYSDCVYELSTKLSKNNTDITILLDRSMLVRTMLSLYQNSCKILCILDIVPDNTYTKDCRGAVIRCAQKLLSCRCHDNCK